MKKDSSHNNSHNKIIYSILLSVLLIVIAFYLFNIIAYFIPAICIGLFIIYVTRPIYANLEKIIKNRSIPIAITITLVIIITLWFSIQFISVAVTESFTILNNPTVTNIMATQYDINTTDIQAEILKAIQYDKIMMLLESPDIKDIQELKTYSSQISYGINIITSILFTIGYMLLQLIVAFMIAFYCVRERKKIEKFIMDGLAENHKKFTKKVMQEIDISLNNIFMGLFLTSVLTGTLAYIIFIYYNLPYPVLLATATAIFTLIPIIGAWLIYTPISMLMFFSGDPQTAITFFILNLIIVSSIPDWITKPLIIAKEKKMNLLIVIISFIGGAALFGPIGFILGPIIVAISTSLVYAFVLETRQDNKTILNP